MAALLSENEVVPTEYFPRSSGRRISCARVDVMKRINAPKREKSLKANIVSLDSQGSQQSICYKHKN